MSLTSQTLLRQQDDVPRVGWRRFVHKATGGAYNPGLSQAEVEHRAMVARVTTPVRGSNRIAVVSLKGGIGKTTTTSCLGLTLAHHRGDRVVAVDANPDAGTLAERLTNVTDVTVRDLLANLDSIRSFTDVSAYTSLAGRLQVLASDQDPALSEAFSEEEYKSVADILARYFNIILTDSGTGLLHSAMSGTLAIADSLVVVGAPSVDGASRASKTLDWLIAHGHEELVARSVAVISSVRPNTGDVDMKVLRDHFAARCRAVIEIPYDAHLVTGGLIDLERIAPSTRSAYLELSAAVADGFGLPPLQRKPAAQA
jgi:MinD-like ATPase involved in chromosome partitioning or flagellar assembly